MSSTKVSKTTNQAPHLEEEHEEGSHAPHTGCGILGRYPVISVLAFAAAGVAIGIGLSTWEGNDDGKATTVKWLGLVGDMFIRALKAVVLPLVFVNVILSIVDMMSVGRASAVGGKAIMLYLFTTLVASIIGIVSIMVFKGTFKTETMESNGLTRVKLGCSEEDEFLSFHDNGTVFCAASSLAEADEIDNHFTIVDVDGSFLAASSGPAELSFSDTIYDGVFGKMITSNIFADFVDSNFAAVVLFAIAMGAALAKSLARKNLKSEDSIFITFLKELDAVLITLIHWIITITPFAVFSLISSAVGSQTNLADSFSNVAFLCLSVMSGMFVHVFFVYTSMFKFITGDNPFGYFRYILPAQTTAFACASSAATMPVTLECAEASGRVPTSIARFVIPLGATVNMDGSAIYFPCACVWLAVLNGITPSFGNYILLAILSTIGSAGTAPVPSAGLVMVLTAYNSVFGTTGVPDGFEFIVAIDWFLDRLQTVVNVSGDAIVAASIAHMVKLDGDEEDFPVDPTVTATKNGEISADTSDAAQEDIEA